jgi:hypothetical protein
MSLNFKTKLMTALGPNVNENQIYYLKLVKVSIKQYRETKFIYFLYLINLNSHKMHSFFLFRNKPDSESILTKLEEMIQTESKSDHSESLDLPSLSLVIIKESPFMDKDWIPFLDEKRISYYYYPKKDSPEMITIADLYTKRMLELHAYFNNHDVKNEFTHKMIKFWNLAIVPVTYNLINLNLIESSIYLEQNKSKILELELFKNTSIYEEDPLDKYILFNVKLNTGKRIPVTYMGIYEWSTGIIIQAESKYGYFEEQDVIDIINQIPKVSNRMLYIQNEGLFSRDSVLRTLIKNKIQFQFISETVKSNSEENLVLGLLFIIQNYLKDSNKHLVKKMYNEKVKDPLTSLVTHWNLHKMYIIYYQGKLTSEIYKDSKYDSKDLNKT